MTSVVGERVSKHLMLRDVVRGLARDLGHGAALPSERELGARFSVARMTVRQAVDGLVAEGLLQRVPGRGTFVVDPAGRRPGLLGFGERERARGRVAESQTLAARCSVGPSAVVAALGVPASDEVWHWRRLRLVDTRPVAVEDVWFTPGVLPEFDPGRPPVGLFEALGARDLRPNAARESVGAALASVTEAQLLRVPPPAAVLRVDRQCLVGDHVVVVSRTTYRADAHRHLGEAHATS